MVRRSSRECTLAECRPGSLAAFMAGPGTQVPPWTNRPVEIDRPIPERRRPTRRRAWRAGTAGPGAAAQLR